MDWDPEEIEKIRREEQARGKKPPVPEEIIREKIKKLKDLQNLLEKGDLILFENYLHAHGLKQGTKEWEEAIKVWKEFFGTG
jgi:hypothetical protein